MASFSTLPNELLIEIWRHVLHPEDIESFAMTSKSILALAKPFLEEHRALKKEFSTFSTWQEAGEVSAGGLLKEITINPRVALYVERLIVNCWRHSWETGARQASLSEESNNGISYVHKPYAETDMQIFEQVVKRNEYAFGKDMFEVLIKAIREGREDPIIALLLLLLTNLKGLAVARIQDHPHFSQALLHVSNARTAEALRCLSEVDFFVDYHHDDNSLLMLKAFAALPSIKRISGLRLANAANHRGKKVDVPLRSSNLETLINDYDNESNPIDTMAFTELIKGCKGLKCFVYTSVSDHKMFAMRNTLVANARYSLDTLVLVPDIPTRKSIGSFRGFKALKRLEINHMHLADFDPRRGLYAVDVLPSSLEELHLRDSRSALVSVHTMCMHPRHCIDPRRIGTALLAERDRHVPNLKLVTVRGDFNNLDPDFDATAPNLAELQALFIVRGLRLELLDADMNPIIFS